MAEAKGELVVLHDKRDRLEANRLVRKLESKGYHVALKDSPLGQRRSKPDAPTVVLWSRHAGAGNLRTALNNESAVVAKLDGRAAPLGATVTDLRGWRGQDRHQGWKTLLEAVGPAGVPVTSAKASIVAAPAAAPKAASNPATSAKSEPSQAPAKKSKALNGIMMGVAAAVLVVGVGWAAALYLF